MASRQMESASKDSMDRQHFMPPPPAALIIIDMQREFGSMMDAPLPYITELYKYFEECGWPIIFTQHGHEPEEFIPPIKNQLIRKVGPESALKVGTRAWELTPEIWKMAKDYPVVAKNTYDAFERTKLGEILQEAKVSRVVVCGVMTEICCETTHRSAFVKDYESWMISDACGTDDPKGHERALESARRLTDSVMTTKEALSKLREKRMRRLMTASLGHLVAQDSQMIQLFEGTTWRYGQEELPKMRSRFQQRQKCYERMLQER